MIKMISTRTIRILLVTALAVISYLAFTPQHTPVIADINDKVSHILAFFALSFLVDFSWPQYKWGAAKYIPLFGYGLLIEAVQASIPHRVFSGLDLFADVLGLLAYPLLLPLLLRIPQINDLRYSSNK
jgi:VanZ family protein